MQIFTMNYLMTMQHLPQLDRKIVGYGVLWTLAIAAAVTGIIGMADLDAPISSYTTAFL